MKLLYFLLFLGLIFFLILSGCSSKPSVSDAQKLFVNIYTLNHPELIEVTTFRKVNAQRGELMGIKFYKLEYEANIKFLADIYEFDREREIELSDGKLGYDMPEKWIEVSNWGNDEILGSTIHRKGEQEKVNGILTFNMTEKGWRGEDGNIY